MYRYGRSATTSPRAPSTTRGIRAGEFYSQGHLDRLRLIQRFKEAYLPLKEIRRRLSGLSDEEVRSLLVADDNRQRRPRRLRQGLLYDESLPGPGLPCWSLARSTERSRWLSSFRRPPRAVEASWLNQISGLSQRGAEGHGLREPPKVEHRLSGTSP